MNAKYNANTVALRAGVPTIITPVFLDQFDNAHVVEKLGVGIGFKKPLQKIRAEELAAAIETVLLVGGGEHHSRSGSSMAEKARRVGAAMQKECGTDAVVYEVERYLKEEVATGNFCAMLEEWKFTTKTLRAKIERRKSVRNSLFFAALVGVVLHIVYTYFDHTQNQ